jgi:hypothetical protein
VIPAIEIGGWALAAAAMAGGANQVLKLVDRMKERPPPSETYTTLTQCEHRHHTIGGDIIGLRADLHSLRMEIRTDLKETAAANEQRSSKLHGRIDDLLEAVSELRGKLSK